MEKPIGWWLKHVDGLLEEALDAAVAADGLDRRGWQVVNVLAEAPANAAEVATALRPFDPNGSPVRAALDALVRRGWVTPEAPHRLTERGERGRTAAVQRVAALRARVSEGVTPEEYATTVATLRRMASNVAPPVSPADS